MREQETLETLEHHLGHAFGDRELLLRALTHRSYASEAVGGPARACDHNEQLEHLGDSILGFMVSEHLYHAFPELSEGRLTQMKSQLVNATHLYGVALTLQLGRFLILGKTEEVNGGREKKALLANAMEAIIAALYLDGGIERCKRFVLDRVVEGNQLMAPLPDISAVDHKGALQEMARLKRLPAPHYSVVREEGPQHAKLFTVEVRVGDAYRSAATGTTKKLASQRAAETVLGQLQLLPA
jgi:ribonuclease-3